MWKLILFLIIFIASGIFMLNSLVVFKSDGISSVERAATWTAILFQGVSVWLINLHISKENKKTRREIARIDRQIARNEAEQRAILRELNATQIMNRLPKNRR